MFLILFQLAVAFLRIDVGGVRLAIIICKTPDKSRTAGSALNRRI